MTQREYQHSNGNNQIDGDCLRKIEFADKRLISELAGCLAHRTILSAALINIGLLLLRHFYRMNHFEIQ